jgi:hypothetical protein
MVDDGVVRDSMSGSTTPARSEMWVVSQHNGFLRERRIPITGQTTSVPVGLPAEGGFPATSSAVHNYKGHPGDRQASGSRRRAGRLASRRRCSRCEPEATATTAHWCPDQAGS